VHVDREKRLPVPICVETRTILEQLIND